MGLSLLVFDQVVERVGEPEVQRQRGKWTVRQGGYDPATGRRRVKQLGTFDTKRAAIVHQKAVSDGRVGSDDETLGEFVEQVWLPSKRDRVEVVWVNPYYAGPGGRP